MRANKAKMKTHEQLSKYEKMENYVAGRCIQIRQTEQALHIAEAIMLKAQALVASYWAQYGEPVLNLLREKVSEKVVAANKWTIKREAK